MSDSSRTYPRIAVQGDSLLCVSYVALKNGLSQLFLARIRPELSADNLVTSVQSSASGSPPSSAFLAQNYPNPFNPSTTISYDLPTRSLVSLKIFNVLGQEVATLVNGEVETGKHQVNWDAAGLPSGAYVYRLKANEFTETKKLVLLR